MWLPGPRFIVWRQRRKRGVTAWDKARYAISAELMSALEEGAAMGGPPATEKLLARLVGGCLMSLSLWQTSRLQDRASRTRKTYTADLGLRLCPQVTTLRCTEIGKFGTCPFLLDKFCKATKKRTGNPWKKLGKRMSSSQAH